MHPERISTLIDTLHEWVDRRLVALDRRLVAIAARLRQSRQPRR